MKALGEHRLGLREPSVEHERLSERPHDGARQPELGLGTTEATGTPTRVALSDVAMVAAGGRHTCALTSEGLYCWGDNSHGQLGLDPTKIPFRTEPTRVPLD